MNKMHNLTYRKAKFEDLPDLLYLLCEEDRPGLSQPISIEDRYIKAFHHIAIDANQYLMVVVLEEKIVATCHLTLIPSLAIIGGTRLQIQAVNVLSTYRSQKIGTWMMQQAIAYGKAKGAEIIQLTTDKQNETAQLFYKKLGFKNSHEGMRLRLD